MDWVVKLQVKATSPSASPYFVRQPDSSPRSCVCPVWLMPSKGQRTGSPDGDVSRLVSTTA